MIREFAEELLATKAASVHHEPTQAAGAALLSLAWQHRKTLLSR